MSFSIRYRLQNFSASARLSVMLNAAIMAVLSAAALAITGWFNAHLEADSLHEQQQISQQVVAMVDAYAGLLESSTRTLGLEFADKFSGTLTLDTQTRVPAANQALPVLRLNGQALNSRFDVVDHFTKTTGATATVFVREGDEFFRAITSVRMENRERAVGTTLGKQHPAYPLLINGQSYTGRATLFGRDFMTHYQPLLDSQGQTVGVAYIGVDFTEGLLGLKRKILAIPVGKSGYVYAIDAQQHPGQFMIHPTQEGQNLLEQGTPYEREFFRQIIATGEGYRRYQWADV